MNAHITSRHSTAPDPRGNVDAGELASPGGFYGQPLNVVVETNADVVGLSGSISLVVQMEKK